MWVLAPTYTGFHNLKFIMQIFIMMKKSFQYLLISIPGVCYFLFFYFNFMELDNWKIERINFILMVGLLMLDGIILIIEKFLKIWKKNFWVVDFLEKYVRVAVAGMVCASGFVVIKYFSVM